MILDTIVAPATPYGIGGISVVRLSGPQSLKIAHKAINNNNLSSKVEHRLAIRASAHTEDGNEIDEAVYTYFKAPHSYTGEDIIEISSHGNPIIVENIVKACSSFGARLAEPGEFTRRAFINGKMDLIQAESVASLIHSQSEESSKLNLRLLRGELSENLNHIRKQLVNAASLIEFEFDMSEDILQPNLVENVASIINDCIKEIKNLLSSYKQARLLNRGALVVIAGETNVGKSTLLNFLTESDRAITSNLPGTTRDAIDVPLILEGVPIHLIDTAGIRNAQEEIEQEGVRRSKQYINRADLIILVHDITAAESSNIEIPAGIPIIEIINKSDLGPIHDKATVINLNNSLQVSAKTGSGIDLLKEKIKKSLGISSKLADTLSITTSRQQIALIKCITNLGSALDLLSQRLVPYELLSIEIREALESLGTILGKTTPDDILNNIFNQFCVGK